MALEPQIGEFGENAEVNELALKILNKYLKYPFENCPSFSTIYITTALQAVKEALLTETKTVIVSDGYLASKGLDFPVDEKVEIKVDQDLRDDLAGLARYVAAEIEQDDVELRKWCVERAKCFAGGLPTTLRMANDIFNYIKTCKHE